MKQRSIATITVLSASIMAASASAQSLTITNARVIDGTGKVIEHGSVVVKDGKITSVGNGGAGSGARIDAHGMTVMAGFIDAHRHLIRGESTAWLKDKAAANMQAFIDAGFTSVFSMGDEPQGILELRRRLSSGELAGPTLYAAKILPLSKPAPRPANAPPPGAFSDPARTDPARPPDRPMAAPIAISDEDSRAAVKATKDQGFDAIKTFMLTTPGGPEGHTLSVIAEEAHKQGLRVFTHTTAVEDSVAAANAHIDVFAHTPHIGRLEDNENARQAIAGAHIPMVSTLAVFIPHFDDQNKALFRDGGPFPMSRPLSSGGQGGVNARLLWEAGVTYAYGTDTTWDPRVSLYDELRALSLMFSPTDIVKIMGPNAAAAIGKSSEVGTLEAGKTADIVIVDGNPLDDVFALTHAVLVIKNGKVIVDKRHKH